MQGARLLPAHIVRSCRLIAGRRYPLASPTSYRHFHQSLPRSSRSPSEPNGSSNSNEDASNEIPPADVHNASSAENAEPGIGKQSSIGRKSYVSSLRRAMKDKRGPLEKAPVNVSIPQWFYDRNVALFDSNEKTKKSHTRPVVIEVPQKIKEKNAQAESTGGDNGDNTGRQDSSEDRYLLKSAVWRQLQASTKAGFMLPSEEYANHPSAEKSHLLLHYPGDDGIVFLDAVVQKLAHDFEANLVTLNAQDIAQLCSEQERLHGATLSSIRDLGYEVYNESPPELPEKQDLAANNTGTPLPLPFSARTTAYTASGPDNQIGRLAQNTESTTWSLLINQILSTTPKSVATNAGGDASFPNNEKRSSSQSKLIIQIQDYLDLLASREGSKFIKLLQNTIQNRRRHGEQILLVGTLSKYKYEAPWLYGSSDAFSADLLRLQSSTSDSPFARCIKIFPSTSSKTVNQIFAGDRKSRKMQINIRHIQDMIRTRVNQKFTSLDNDIFDDALWSSNATLKQRLQSKYWDFNRVHALVTSAMGRTQLNDTFSLDHIQQGLQTIEKSDLCHDQWLLGPSASKKRDPAKEATEKFNARLAVIKQNANRYEKKLFNGIILPPNIRTTFADVHVPPDTIEGLKTLTSLSLLRPEAFKYGVLATDKIPGMLLYGPPGTGKTLLAKAVARESGAIMLEVSGSDIYDMYVGEGEKNVKAIFSLAKKLTPCVVFIDEADAIFGARGAGASRQRTSHREIINQFLREWDGMKEMSAFIMVATNRPFDLDDAVLRRLPRRMLVDLPTQKDRESILRLHLKNEQLDASVDLSDLAGRTPFYSGSDLKNFCVASALACVREEYDQATKHTGEEPYKYPEQRVLTRAHFERGINEISASISEDMSSLQAIRKFDEKYGDRKGRRKKSAAWGFTPLGAAPETGETGRVRT
ncbi:hypothetical protein BGW36DRAFT_457050 [Talaromyces proteolyticus]|uniref:AAA+ ATPase domain-containing protein n=1 Tax=Talaromyces proteolyticus TaxID=1131652 RepID=A0AAD4L149_9EURO|nr:uncharacterized protein BGW36DRAFT_457050 [Talaromyces proteolyticus]KAH8705632.1 hypothetical protein BGW36DRAFT_457050 [Talaromyces proteolyticus]